MPGYFAAVLSLAYRVVAAMFVVVVALPVYWGTVVSDLFMGLALIVVAVVAARRLRDLPLAIPLLAAGIPLILMMMVAPFFPRSEIVTNLLQLSVLAHQFVLAFALTRQMAATERATLLAQEREPHEEF